MGILFSSSSLKMMNSDEGFTCPVSIGNPKEFSILELAHKIIELTESKSKIVYKALPQDNPIQRKPDISLVRKHLKWQPKAGLELGLKRTIEYFNNIL